MFHIPPLPHKHPLFHIILIVPSVIFLGAAAYFYQHNITLNSLVSTLTSQKNEIDGKLALVQSELDQLKSQDQVKVNQDLKSQIASIQSSYDRAVKLYEEILSFRDRGGKAADLEKLLAQALTQLSKKEFSSANETLDKLKTALGASNQKLDTTLTASVPTNVPSSNTPPSSGYSRQQVTTDVGTFTVSIISADLSSTKVVIDTASNSDCSNDCPVLPLATYISRNGAYAGINGTYFCPASYPSCVGKTNSFDLLVMNKEKHYFNSDNNVYSSNPAVIFGNGYVRFINQASEWGRDTGVDGVISNFPMLVFNRQIVVPGTSDPKMTGKGPRGFIASEGNKVFIGVVSAATMSDAAHVLHALGMNNAMNLDEGGSTALWYGGYKAGPGRDVPNALLFIKK